MSETWTSCTSLAFPLRHQWQFADTWNLLFNHGSYSSNLCILFNFFSQGLITSHHASGIPPPCHSRSPRVPKRSPAIPSPAAVVLRLLARLPQELSQEIQEASPLLREVLCLRTPLLWRRGRRYTLSVSSRTILFDGRRNGSAGRVFVRGTTP